MLNEMLNKEPAPMQSGKSRLFQFCRGLFAGKKIFTITILIIGLTAFTNAQGITNTLGGNTSTDKFIVENSDSKVGLVVTGESKVGIGTEYPSALLEISYASNTDYTPLAFGENGLDVFRFDAKYSGSGIENNWLNLHDFWGNDIMTWRNNRIGIGYTNPHATLHVISTTTSDADNTAKFEATSIGSNASHIHYGTKGDWYIRSAASNGKVVIQDSGGKVGIGTNNPEATLDVEGTVKLGANGLVFSEIIELTGNTSGSTVITFSYPVGYDMNNTRTLSIEIKVNGDRWISSGRDMYCRLLLDNIEIVYPATSTWYNKPFRMVLMKVE